MCNSWSVAVERTLHDQEVTGSYRVSGTNTSDVGEDVGDARRALVEDEGRDVAVEDALVVDPSGNRRLLSMYNCQLSAVKCLLLTVIC